MADLKAPHGRGVIQVSDESVERFEAAGWTKVEQPKPRKRSKAADESDEK